MTKIIKNSIDFESNIGQNSLIYCTICDLGFLPWIFNQRWRWL